MSMPSSKKPGDILSFSSFKFDNRGILGLPLKVVVTLIIGATAMGLVVGYVMTNTPEADTLEVSTNTRSIEEGLGQEIAFTVRDGNGNPVKDATVTCTGCGDAIAGKTNKDGRLTLEFDPLLSSEHRSEEYLDVKVRAGGFNTYQKEQMIQVTEADYSGFLDAAEEYADKIVKAEGEELENYRLIEEFPASIEGTVNQQGTEEKADIYVIDPEIANKIPDDFYISFLGDGATGFRFAYLELYADTPFPEPVTVAKIDWIHSNGNAEGSPNSPNAARWPSDGYIGDGWLWKEIQGCNSVDTVKLEHKSPRTVMIVIERYEDWYGSGEYTLRLDDEKHYNEMYKGYEFINSLITQVENAINSLNTFLKDNYDALVSFLSDPTTITQVQAMILRELNQAMDTFRTILLETATVDNIKAAYQFITNNQVIEILTGIDDSIGAALTELVGSDFYFILEDWKAPWGDENFLGRGLKFGFHIGQETFGGNSQIEPTGILFLDSISPVPLPTPVLIPNLKLDMKTNFQNQLLDQQGEMDITANLNPISYSDRNFEVSAKLEVSASTTHTFVAGGEIGAFAEISVAFDNQALTDPIKTFMSELHQEEFLSDDGGDGFSFTLILGEQDKKPESYNQYMALIMDKCYYIIEKMYQSLSHHVTIGISLGGSGEAGAGLELGVGNVDADIAGDINFGLSGTLNTFHNLITLGKQYLNNLSKYLFFQAVVYACDLWGHGESADVQSNLLTIKSEAQQMVKKIEARLDKSGTPIWETISNNIYLEIGAGAGLDVGGEAGAIGAIDIDCTPIGVSGNIQMNIGTALYLVSLGNIPSDQVGITLSLRVSHSITVGGGLEFKVLEAGGAISFSTTKEIIAIKTRLKT